MRSSNLPAPRRRLSQLASTTLAQDLTNVLLAQPSPRQPVTPRDSSLPMSPLQREHQLASMHLDLSSVLHHNHNTNSNYTTATSSSGKSSKLMKSPAATPAVVTVEPAPATVRGLLRVAVERLPSAPPPSPVNFPRGGATNWEIWEGGEDEDEGGSEFSLTPQSERDARLK